MKNISTIVLLILPFFSFAQSKSLSIPHYSDGAVDFWYNYKLATDSTLGLNSIENSTNQFYFRFRTEIQIIEITSENNKNFKGSIINIGEYVAEKPGNKPPKTYKSILPIDTNLIQDIVELIDSLNLKNILGEHDIQNWKKTVDGTIYIMEFSNPSNYSFKYYGSPESQKNIMEANKINMLVNFLNAKLHLKDSWFTFIKTLPKGCYHAGNYYVACNYIKSNKKNRH